MMGYITLFQLNCQLGKWKVVCLSLNNLYCYASLDLGFPIFYFNTALTWFFAMLFLFALNLVAQLEGCGVCDYSPK